MSKEAVTSLTNDQPKTVKRDILLPIIMVALSILYIGLGLVETAPPAATRIETIDNQFSSARALKHIEAISQIPHPTGSSDHDRVRDYISNQLASLGVSPEIQKTTALTSGTPPPIFAGAVENIIGRLPGANSEKAVMLVSHYDSVPNSPGASDNGAGVAALLECLRALKASPQLKNDIIFLFTDGEETGLLGARAFADNHPLVDDVWLVLNFEARGSSGPSMLFETSANNGWLIEEFAHAAPHPIASSLFYELYRLLPNDTDLSIFKKRGLAGLNFAFIKGLPDYHTGQDNLASLDERSLQHHGSYALSLSRHFANQDVQAINKPDQVYFNFIGPNLIRYTKSIAIALMVLAILAFFSLTIFGLIKKQLTLIGIAAGVGLLLASIILTPLLISILWLILKAMQGDDGARFANVASQNGFYLLGFTGLIVALISPVQSYLAKRFGTESLTAGVSLVWLLLLIPTAIFVPSVSFLFTWPLLFSLVGLGSIICSRNGDLTTTGIFISLAVTALPAFAIACPIIYLLPVALGMSYVGLPMLVVALLANLLTPQLLTIARLHKLFLPLIGILTFLCAIIAGSWGNQPNLDNPKPNHLLYVMDFDKQEASWASADPKPDEWTSQFISPNAVPSPLAEYSPYIGTTYLKSQAPKAKLDPPILEVLEDKTVDGHRRLKLRLRSQRQAPVFILRAESKIEIFAVWIDGKQYTIDNLPLSLSPWHPWFLHFHGLPSQGVEVVLDVNPSLPLKFRAIDQTYGLPVFEDFPYHERPNTQMASAFYDSDSTFVARSFAF